MKKIVLFTILFILFLCCGCQTDVPLYQTYITPIKYFDENDNEDTIPSIFTAYDNTLDYIDNDGWRDDSFIKLDAARSIDVKHIINELVKICYSLDYKKDINIDDIAINTELKEALFKDGYFNREFNAAVSDKIITIIPESIILPNNSVKINGTKIKTYSYIGIDYYSLNCNTFCDPLEIKYYHKPLILVIYLDMTSNNGLEIYKWVEIEQKNVIDQDNQCTIRQFTSGGVFTVKV